MCQLLFVAGFHLAENIQGCARIQFTIVGTGRSPWLAEGGPPVITHHEEFAKPEAPFFFFATVSGMKMTTPLFCWRTVLNGFGSSVYQMLCETLLGP